MTPAILLGRSDFASLRERGGLYVDKSAFVSGVLGLGAEVQLHPRPRRFGKTLNLSTLRYFLERGEDRTALFEDLSVWQDEAARQHFQRYPVINLTFKNIKQSTWAAARAEMLALLASEVGRHASALEDPRLDEGLRARLRAVLRQEGENVQVLADLSQALAAVHGQPVAILIDEYDAPVLTAWEYGYYDEAAAWFRGFLSAGLKDNPHLFKGVLTGILRIARESMFSDLNNVSVYSLLQREIPEPFGFSEAEVQALLTQFGRPGEAGDVRRWYNGYRFGGEVVYNPWSILNFLSRPGQGCQPWWLNTSSNTLLRQLLLERSELNPEFATLLRGEAVERQVREDVTLRELGDEDVWSLLLFSGYLKAESVHLDEWGQRQARLAIPNQEVAIVWRDTFLDWLQAMAGRVEPLQRAILEGDAPVVENLLSTMLLRHVSSHDVRRTQDEAFYHAFVLGLMISLEKTHTVRSNRETGRGRADVLIAPRQTGQPGVVLEFKRLEPGRTLEDMADEALQQIHDRAYTAALEAAGAYPIHRLGIAFAGKDVAVRSG